MKKTILVVIFTLITVHLFAQKVKIDKGEVKLDGKTVAYLEGKIPFYTITNLEKSYSITAELKNIPHEEKPTIPWVEVRNTISKKSNEFEFTTKKLSVFHYDKNVITELLERNFLSTNGLDSIAIEAFINAEPTGISYRLLGTTDKNSPEHELADSYGLAITNTGDIHSIKATNTDSNGTKIGKIIKIYPSKNGELKYQVTDLDNNIIGTWYLKSGAHPNFYSYLDRELITRDHKVFKIVPDKHLVPTDPNLDNDKTAMNIVRTLIINDYTLGNQLNELRRIAYEKALKELEERIETERLNSKNIYDEYGFVLDEDESRTTGIVTALFESIPAEKTNESDVTAYGKSIIMRVPDIGGTYKKQEYKSKDGTRFCIEFNNRDECYLGLKTIGNTSVIKSTLSKIKLDFSSFYKILYDENKYMVLVDPIKPLDFVIKIPQQEKGLYTNKSSGKTLKKNAIEYLNCDAFIFEEHDFNSLEGLIKVLEDYQTKCNK